VRCFCLGHQGSSRRRLGWLPPCCGMAGRAACRRSGLPSQPLHSAGAGGMACSCVVPSWGEAALRCSLWIVNQVLVHLWTRRASRVALAPLHPCGAGWFGAGAGCPWLCWHGCLTRSISLMTRCLIANKAAVFRGV